MTKKLSKMDKTINLVRQLDAKGLKAAEIKARIQKQMKFNTLAAASTYMYLARDKIRKAGAAPIEGALVEKFADLQDAVVKAAKRVRKATPKKTKLQQVVEVIRETQATSETSRAIGVMAEELLAA